MKKRLILALMLISSVCFGQSSTPNIGLQIPATGSNNWYIPLNYNFTKLDQLLSGNLPLPALSITNNLTVGGTVTANAFLGTGGAGFATTPGAARYSLAYFGGTGGTTTQIAGFGFTGIPKYSTTALPTVAVGTDFAAAFTSCGPSTPLLSYTGACTGLPSALVINSFTCSTCGTYENGFTVASPTNFTASYSTTPASASITDGTNVVNLTTPFTSGSQAHAYTGNTTFTLTAIGATTATSSQTIAFAARTFAGAGTAGATTATSSGTTAILNGSRGTLPSAGLGNQSTYACSASANKCYILMIGGSHTFKDAATGFPFVFAAATSVSFVNQNGATVAMFLYESTNTLTGSFTIQVAS